MKPDATARTCTRRSPSGVATVSTASPDLRARFRIRPGISPPSPRAPVARPAASHSSRSTATRSGTSRDATADSSGSRSSSRGQATCRNSAANAAGITAGETRSAVRRPGRMTPNDDTVAPSGLRIVSVSPSSGKLSSAPLAQSARARSSRCVRSPAGSHGSRDAEATRRSQRLTASARTAAPSARAIPSAAAIAASACLRRPSASPAATRSVAAARMNTAVAARDRRSVWGDGRTRRASASASATDASARHGTWPVDPAVPRAATRAPSPTAAAAPALRRVAPGLGRRDAHASAAAASASRPVWARKSGRPRGTRLIVSKRPGVTRAAARPRRPGASASGIARMTPAGCGARARAVTLPISARARPSAARPVRNVSAGVLKSPRRGAGSHPTANTPEAPTGVPSRRANRAATIPAAGLPAASPRAAARTARRTAGLRALVRRTSSSAISGSDVSTESARSRSRLSDPATRSLRRVGPSGRARNSMRSGRRTPVG